ncbi:MAG: ATP-binding cassette domain-containing protein [Pseudomonadota bacterium]|nr:MAG: ABC transporter ATP-binding protein [Pseudomonadota bacterium]
MLVLSDVRLRRGSQVLIEGADLTVFRGEKIGIVGRNGCGKSTLLALICGDLAPDAGEYTAPPGLTISWVAQELPETDAPLVEYVLDGDVELRQVEAGIARATESGDGARLALLHAEYERLGGYAARARAARLCDGLGFDPGELERPVREFSGGLQMRANLARALMRRSDLLLLDEPTNHLDLDAVLWLEQWLREYAGTLLLVSHDRELLDAIVGRIVHIEGGQLRAYAGNYSAFETQYAAQREQTRARMIRQQREVERIRAFVERFRAKASKARQVQSRLKWLARLETIAPLHVDETFEWEFAEPAKLPRPLVSLEEVAAGYPGRRVLEKVSLTINPGDRLGVLGRNGAGKSTLMRMLAGQLAPLGGRVTFASDVVTGFFAQSELERLDPRSTPIGELASRGGELTRSWSEQQLRDHLGRFGFRGDRVFEPTASFSGGERARLALAILVARRPNLLLLDEPTNHLDFEMRQALLLALQEFPGAVVVVSHDRALLRGACDRFVLVGHGTVREFDGDLEDYAAWLRTPAPDSAPARPNPERSAAARREQRRLEAEARNRLSPLRAEQRRIERRIEELGAERDRLERELADPELYTTRPLEERQALAQRHARIRMEIEALEARWLEIGEALEAHAAAE